MKIIKKSAKIGSDTEINDRIFVQMELVYHIIFCCFSRDLEKGKWVEGGGFGRAC